MYCEAPQEADRRFEAVAGARRTRLAYVRLVICVLGDCDDWKALYMCAYTSAWVAAASAQVVCLLETGGPTARKKSGVSRGVREMLSHLYLGGSSQCPGGVR